MSIFAGFFAGYEQQPRNSSDLPPDGEEVTEANESWLSSYEEFHRFALLKKLANPESAIACLSIDTLFEEVRVLQPYSL